MIRAVIAVAVAGVAALVLSATAFAAPNDQVPVEVDCGSAGTFTVLSSPGNGTFTPGRIVGGGLIIPVSFTNQHSTFTDNEGNTFEEDEPDATKAHVPANKELINCSFTATFSDESGTGTFSGDVKGFLVPPR